MITIQILKELYDRDVTKLAEEIKQYADETLIWKTVPGISNSGGNLCLHLCGNLQHFFGAVLSGSGYVRNRDAEFALKDVSREKLLSEIEAARKSVDMTLSKLNDAALSADYPINVIGKITSTEFFLVYLVAHFNYHLGQINYHRRLVK